MFGSRRQRQPVQQPLTATTANPNAATAAAAVFKRHESNSSLSAAAAAAALAARPMTPTRVSEVQTKRTLRRSASTASSAGSSDTYGRPGLQRRGSSGSMTERSFRSPSPHRPASSGLGHRQSQSESHVKHEEMPPVPALPREVEAGGGKAVAGTKGGLSHRRATSLGIRNTPVRLASQSLGSADAPSWFGAAKMGDLGNVRRTDPAMASPPSSPPQAIREPQREERGRPGSRASSINFSYPTRVKVGSPPVSPVDTRHSTELPLPAQPPRQVTEERQPSQSRQPRSQPRKRLSSSEPSNRGGALTQGSSEQVLVYDPNSRRMVPQSSLRQAAPQHSEQPPSSRRRKQNQTRAGSHLVGGTMNQTKASSSNAPSETKFEPVNALPQIQPQIKEQPSRGKSTSESEEPAVKASESSPRIDARSKGPPSSNHMAQSNAQYSQSASSAVPAPDSQSMGSPKQVVKRQPSVVREEPEPEPEPDRPAQRVISDALDSVPARQRVQIEGRQEIHPTSPKSQSGVPSLSPPAASPSSSSQDPTPVASSIKEVLHIDNPEIPQLSSSVSERASSNSPARQAHFGSVSSKLTVRHSPPPRSISPRKSALKQTSPTREISPSDDTSEASAGVAAQEEPPVSRKKSVRVSFDDGNTVVVGESAPVDQTGSPILASPQAATSRRPWYGSLGRSRKVLPPLDDDEVMKPRPALPSFGSIRDKKPREPVHEDEERPLVRPPTDKAYTPAAQKSPEEIGELRPVPAALGQSSDHAAGTILVKEHDERSRNPANISRFREPLPPVVTSVEGSGYISDSSSSFESEGPAMTDGAPSQAEPSEDIPTETSLIVTPQAISPSNSGAVAVTGASPGEQGIHEMAIPGISVSHPTPPVVEKRKSAASFLNVPGGFPQDDSDTPTPLASRTTTPAVRAVKDSLPVHDASQASLEAVKEPPSDSESSIYSDAYEDLSDIDADGFQSLDAVLETIPTLTQIEERAKQGDVSGRLKAVLPSIQPELEIRRVATDTATPPVAPEDEWEKAKAYWRSLTKEKRVQLEREAMEEAGVDGDLEETKPEPKPKKKKSVERRNSERQAVAVQLAKQQETRQNEERRIAPAKRTSAIRLGAPWSEDETAGPSLRKTLRVQPLPQAVPPGSSDSPRFRKSMRTTIAVNSGEPIQPSWSKPFDKRPLSLSAELSSLKVSGSHGREMSEQSSVTEPHTQKTTAFPPPLRRRGSTSSESSFKRSRPNAGAQVTGFRTSMRPTSASSQPEKRTSKRFSLRSLSPASQRTSSGPPVSLGSGMQMRHTLRDSSSERKKSSGVLHMPSFSRSPNSKKAGKRTSGSKFSSRFADSSDEDENTAKRGFRSRFDDSSDDEVVSPLALPLPIPSTASYLRNQHSIASTALPEELEESEGLVDNGDTAKVQKEPQIHATPPGSHAVALASGTNLRPAPAGSGKISLSQTAPVIGNAPGKSAERRSSTRASFMSALRRKKPDSTSKISRREITESAARQDTKLERNVSQLRGIRRASGEVNPEAEDSPEDEGVEQEAPRSPRLQKRIVSLSRSIEKANIDAAGLNGSPAASAALSGMPPDPSSPAALPGGATPGPGGMVGQDELIRSPLRRPSAASGNLGTRTLGGGSGAQPGFLQRRTMSAGVMSLDAPSVAGTSQKKKKFGALRRMFGLND